ncbi:hypothetical protein V7S43_019085 [Phytophthora oleae]|uniref:Uncharacterized protein n=1 Tax=Phytophthora oleae TaxID=2107226 RepID=A0ABD3F1C0_9STRA
MSTTNKGFNHQQRRPQDREGAQRIQTDGFRALQDLSSFDAETLDSIVEVQRVLFSSCYMLETESYNVNKKVLDVLTACVVRHFPLLRALNSESPVNKRVEVVVSLAKCSPSELLAWSSHLARDPIPCQATKPSDTHPTSRNEKPTTPTQEQKIVDHQAAVIKHFMEHIKRQDARMDALEAKQSNDPIKTTNKRSCQDEDTEAVSSTKKKQRKGSVRYLHSTWFAWSYAPKQQRSKAKILVAFMKLFLPDGFALDLSTADYRDRVLDLGKRAESAVLLFMRDEHQIDSRGSSAVLKHLQGLHNAGALNTFIQRNQRLLQTTDIHDPAPGYTQDVLKVVRK